MESIKGVCIKVDVMNSRNNRKEKQLKEIADRLNKKFKNGIITDFTVRAGDEIFGILNDFEIGYRAFKELYYLSKVSKVPLYVGVGFGDIWNENLESSDEVNGPAIWNSADALGILKNKEYKMRAIQSLDKNFNFMFIIGKENSNSLIVNYLLYFILEKIEARTEKQSQAIRLIEENPDLYYEEIGIKLGYDADNAKANISNLLKRAEFNLVKEAEQELIKLIDLVYYGEGIK